MLLELPAAVLSQMLQDEAMLTAAVEKALRALQLAPKARYDHQVETGAVMLFVMLAKTMKKLLKMKPSVVCVIPCSEVAQKDEDDVSESSDSLGEQLFELVDVYNTGHSQKITGE